MSNKMVSRPVSNLRGYVVMAGLLGIVLLGGWLAWRYYTLPPELQATAEASKTLDAMFTALTARDSRKLKVCMERIEGHATAGRLSEKGMTEVRHCSQLADSGAWEEAAKRLYWIVYEQR